MKTLFSLLLRVLPLFLVCEISKKTHNIIMEQGKVEKFQKLSQKIREISYIHFLKKQSYHVSTAIFRSIILFVAHKMSFTA